MNEFEQAGRAHSASGAHGDHAVFRFAPASFHQDVADLTRARHAVRMTDRDRTAIHVETILGQAEDGRGEADEILFDLPLVLAGGRDDSGERDVPGFREMSAVLARRIPGAIYRVVADAGHMINMEQPAAVNELLTRFIHEEASWNR